MTIQDDGAVDSMRGTKTSDVTAQKQQELWRSHYRYPSSGRGGHEFENEHLVRLHRQGNQLVFESASKPDKSYLLIRLSLNDDIATGSWQEETEADGYYQGAVYHGALQMVVAKDGKSMTGKWIGFGKDMEINSGPWELTLVEDQVETEQ